MILSVLSLCFFFIIFLVENWTIFVETLPEGTIRFNFPSINLDFCQKLIRKILVCDIRLFKLANIEIFCTTFDLTEFQMCISSRLYKGALSRYIMTSVQKFVICPNLIIFRSAFFRKNRCSDPVLSRVN